MSASKKQQQIWWKKYKENGDDKARENLIMAYAHLVKYIAGKVAIGLPANVDYDDLVSWGIFGLIDAIEKYDMSRGVKFESYALARIRGAMIDGLRATDWVPRSVREKAQRLERITARLEAELGRAATDTEIRKAMGLSRQQYEQLLNEVKVTALLSLDEPWSEGGSDGEKLRLVDMIEDDNSQDPSFRLEEEAVKEVLSQAIDALPERERLVISLYYYEGLTLKEIGRVLDVSESRISQIHTRALARLRGKLSRLQPSLTG